ncbi:MAG: DUF1028 domain-containing protein [Acetobacteraceae bacterium]|nr:DUF1028 domain-containing protein [Acetobacteraceae bacterium]
MTFSILARCPRTRMLGVATATRSFAVGGRVPFAAARLGVVAIMSRADARIGQFAMRLLQDRYKAQNVVDSLVRNDPWAEQRQLAVIDDDGGMAARTGTENTAWAGHQIHGDFIVLGNVLPGPQTLEGLRHRFLATEGLPFEDRLLTALESGRDAGGQVGGQVSAALLVYDQDRFARVDLRVDQHDEPVGELRRVFEAYRPFIPYYVQRQRDPRIAPWHEWKPEV